MSRASRAWAALLAASALLLPAGCNETSTPASQPASARHNRDADTNHLRDWVIDPLIDPSELQLAPQRIVSIAPSITEIVCALGLRDRLVGRSTYCAYPPGIGSVDAVGALDQLNLELLVRLRPDLILVFGSNPDLARQLQSVGLTYESVPDKTIESIFDAILSIGELTGRPRTARRLAGAMLTELRQITSANADTPSRRVLLLTATLSDPPSDPFVAGPGSFYDALLRRAGHRNIVPQRAVSFAPFSLESIVRADPDVIIELDPDGRARPQGDTDARRAWAAVGPLKAVRKRRVHVLAGPQHYLPGPRIAHTYAAICQLIADPDP